MMITLTYYKKDSASLERIVVKSTHTDKIDICEETNQIYWDKKKSNRICFSENKTSPTTSLIKRE